MISPSSVSLLLGLLLVAPCLGTNGGRPGCNRDNVLRAMVDRRHISEALAFCSSYISIPYASETTTSYPVATTTVSTTTVYSAYTPPVYYKAKRDAPLPTFVSQYPASRVSSACSCLTLAPTATRTTTVQTISVTATRTLPALCNPTNFKQYRGAVDRREPVQLRQVPGTTEQECCLSCWNTPNCVNFQFRPDNPQPQGCEYYVGLSQTDPSNRKDICPLGVTIGSGLDTPTPGQYFLNYGPCMDRSPLS